MYLEYFLIPDFMFEHRENVCLLAESVWVCICCPDGVRSVTECWSPNQGSLLAQSHTQHLPDNPLSSSSAANKDKTTF